MSTVNSRTPDYPIDPIFLERWSPRALTGAPISEEELLTLLEAARWAASASNRQPWRFIYARRDTPQWEKLLGLLVPFNQSWAQHASALVFFISHAVAWDETSGKNVPAPTHSFDTGTASGFFALQAHSKGWIAHGMFGFDQERARAELEVPADYQLEAVYAVGRQGEKSQLPEALQAREEPSGRLPLAELAFEGVFRG